MTEQNINNGTLEEGFFVMNNSATKAVALQRQHNSWNIKIWKKLVEGVHRSEDEELDVEDYWGCLFLDIIGDVVPFSILLFSRGHDKYMSVTTSSATAISAKFSIQSETKWYTAI